MRIRIVKTNSGKYAVQVVSKKEGLLKVHKHIGTYNDKQEKLELLKRAEEYIKNSTGQLELFDDNKFYSLSDIKIIESKPLFLYRILSNIYKKIGFNICGDEIIKDLIIARIYKPSSKRETQEILEEEFNRKYSLKTIYRHLKKTIDLGLKEKFQTALIRFSKEELKDYLELIFYDVTTLYFESNLKTNLKDLGFSKDHRPQDVQILLGLIVNKEGFPIYFDIFNGKTFEGHTLIPMIKDIQNRLKSKRLIVVADAAMISIENMDALEAEKIGFIVGARVSNLSIDKIGAISEKISGKDRAITELVYKGYNLICEYSKKRAKKDKLDIEKQLSNANKAIDNPSKMIKKYRFIKSNGNKYIINKGLIEKAKKLEGIKGFLTNTSLTSKAVIERYHDLWKIENTFRITKSDLKARPIFHRLDDSIKAHLIIVFGALAITKYMEIKTNVSIKKVLKIMSKILTHKVINSKTGKFQYIESDLDDNNLKQQIEILKSLGH